MTPTRVVVADDVLLREGLASLLEMKPTAGLAATMSAKSATAWVGIDEIRAVIND